MPSEPDQKTQEPSTPSEPPPRQIPGVPVGPPSSESEVDQEAHEALQMKVAMKMVGSAMVFVGFIQVFLSASTGAEITIFPMILYFSGLALWAHSSVKNVSVRYVVIGLSIVCILGFLQLGKCCSGINTSFIGAPLRWWFILCFKTQRSRQNTR